MTYTRTLDGRLAQSWGGDNPDGVHLNILLAERGSPTAAAMTSSFSSPKEKFTPILVCLGPDQPSYQTLYPPTLMLNKVEVETEKMSALIAGACQVGIGQGVLDAVADGLLVADQETLVFVAVWVNPEAEHDDAVRAAAREATRTGLREAVKGRLAADISQLVNDRDHVTHPFYQG